MPLTKVAFAFVYPMDEPGDTISHSIGNRDGTLVVASARG